MYARNYIDPGTPPSTQEQLVSVEIDGVAVSVPEGTSVMRAASMAGTQIPKLCATGSLKAFGSCRLCLVEIEGKKGYPASCTTTVTPGMKVRTQSEKLTQLRRGVLELYVSDHPLDCDTCPADGHCELQNMAGVIRRDRFAVCCSAIVSVRLWIPAIPISRSIPISASCAPVAYAHAMRLRARSR